MFVDYEYYTEEYKGNSLTETEFNKYAKKACMKITTSTMSRVTDGTINKYPSELIDNIKDCACAITEWIKKFEVALDNIIKDNNEGIVKSKTAGAVTISYDTSQTASYLLDMGKQEQIIKSVINSYLSARCINGVFYNLLSKNLCSSSNCVTCRIN